MSREICITKLDFGGTKFVMHSVLDAWGEDDPIVAEILRGEFDENESLRVWTYLVSLGRAGDLYADVGSYAGIFSLLAANQNDDIRVAAFEASSVTYGRLVSNIILNGLDTRICAGHMAAWNESSTLSFPHRYGIYSMCPGESALENREIDHQERVFASALDELIGAPDHVPGAFGSKALGVTGFKSLVAMKIDVEGAEDRVLEGADRLLREHRPYIICELLTDDAVARITAFLAGYDYKVSHIGEERNYLLCAAEKHHEFSNGYAAWLSNHASDKMTGKRNFTFDVSRD